jgi:hypothetical protein
LVISLLDRRLDIEHACYDWVRRQMSVKWRRSPCLRHAGLAMVCLVSADAAAQAAARIDAKFVERLQGEIPRCERPHRRRRQWRHISHSEGQGYGMLLAYLADNPADFEQIWYFTRTELLLRDDGLAVWKWDPAVTPHVTDTNNASDGDLLIAYALALAGRPGTTRILFGSRGEDRNALLAHAIVKTGGRTVLLPGVEGFLHPNATTVR